MRRKKTLEDWISEALVDRDKSGPCKQLSLVHMIGVGEKEIHTKKCIPNMIPKDLAAMFRAKAEDYCQALPGVQTFALLAFYGEAGEEEARFTFLVNVQVELNGATEPPTQQGEKMQSMRHIEMSMQLVFRQSLCLFEAQQRQLDAMSRQNDLLLRENHDAFAVVKEMMQQQILNNHEHKMKELEYTRKTEERKKWLSYAPALLNTVLGREIFPQGMADTALVETIADSLTGDQLEKIAMTLPPELLGPLMTRVQQHQEKKEKEKQALKQLPVSTVDSDLGD